jgi:hypothetical protein
MAARNAAEALHAKLSGAEQVLQQHLLQPSGDPHPQTACYNTATTWRTDDSGRLWLNQ